MPSYALPGYDEFGCKRLPGWNSTETLVLRALDSVNRFVVVATRWLNPGSVCECLRVTGIQLLFVFVTLDVQQGNILLLDAGTDSKCVCVWDSNYVIFFRQCFLPIFDARTVGPSTRRVPCLESAWCTGANTRVRTTESTGVQIRISNSPRGRVHDIKKRGSARHQN